MSSSLLAQDPASPAGGAGEHRACSLRGLGRTWLVVEDTLRVHVDLHTAAASGGELLVAGVPTYVFTGRAAEPEPVAAPIVGVVLDSTGGVRAIRPPISHAKMGAVRATARDEGGWEAVFVEYATAADPHRDRPLGQRRVARLWNGVYDGGRWTGLRAIAVPDDLLLDGNDVSPLARHDDRLAWMIAGYRGFEPILLLLERTGGHWNAKALDGRGGLYPFPQYAGTMLTYAGIGAGGPGEVNSLFLALPFSPPAAPRRVVHGDSLHRMHFPRLTPWRDRLVLTWLVETPAGSEVWASLDAEAFTPGSARRIAPAREGVRPVSVVELPGGSLAWITLHRRNEAGEADLHVRLLSPQGTSETRQLASPFAAGPIAAAVVGRRVVVVGSVWQEAVPVSLALWLDGECT